MKRQTYGIIAAVSAVAAVVAFLLVPSLVQAFAPVQLNPYSVPQNPKSEQIQQDTNTTSRPLTLDDAFLEIEAQLPGFSGYFFDNQGKLNVYSKLPTQVDKAGLSTILKGFVSAEDMQNGTVVLQSKYSWKELKGWKDALSDLLTKEGSGVTSVDANEKAQTIDVGVEDLTAQTRESIIQFLVQNNIPIDVVQISETGPIMLNSNGISVSPRKGGIEIGFGTSSACTNGFIVNTGTGARRSVTAGHCETTVDTAGDQVYRNPAASGSTTIGTETANTNIYPGPRYSDTLLWTPATGITTSLGKMCKNTACSTEYTITGSKNFPAVGEAVCKYGRTTHETCGSITATDVNVVHPIYSQLWAQDQVTSGFGQPGDSGSPVYKKGTDPNVTIYGIYWGASQSGVHFFSPFNGITADQGTLTVK